MTRRFRPIILVLLAVFLATIGSADAQDMPPVYRTLLPAVGTHASPQPFGVNLPAHYTTPASVALTQALNPRWAHIASISWTLLEPQQGEYHWETLAAIEQAVAQLRLAGIEPIVLITDSPAWARTYADWRCSPPAPQHMAAFATMLEQLSSRYRAGPSAVRYWELWNEPDAFREDIPKAEGGIGCWAERGHPVESGQRYGAALQQGAAAIKRGNASAQVLGGALTYWTADNYTADFLDGMIQSGGVDAIDIVSFHAYGSDSNDDWLTIKASRIRQQLERAGRGGKALLATEVGAPCPYGIGHPLCNPQTPTGNAFFTATQPRYAARIAAESLALGLTGSIWFTAINQSPGFAESHIIDINGDTLLPRPAYYALRNSIRLLQGATYTESLLGEASGETARAVRVLRFQRTDSQVYVMWTHQPDTTGTAQVAVPAGSRALCWSALDAIVPTVADCTPVDGGTMLTRTVNADPQYVEVVPTAQ